MSRSGYCEDLEQWDLIRWRGAVASAIRGKRGQSFLRELLAALDAMPVKSLIAEHLENNGEFCALGAVGKMRGIDMSDLDPDDCDRVAKVFGIAPALAAEIVFENDEAWGHQNGEARWTRMRQWVFENIAKPQPGESAP